MVSVFALSVVTFLVLAAYSASPGCEVVRAGFVAGSGCLGAVVTFFAAIFLYSPPLGMARLDANTRAWAVLLHGMGWAASGAVAAMVVTWLIRSGGYGPGTSA
jgi:hypothetical protein